MLCGFGGLCYRTVRSMKNMDTWNGANFKVTEISGESPFSPGEEFEFPLLF